MSPSTQDIRVTVTFRGLISGSLGFDSGDHNERRTIKVHSPFTVEEAHEAARKALYYADGVNPAWDHVTVTNVAFN